MPLTNAERQKRHRERLKAAASRNVAGLTPEQIADRDAVMAEPLYPTPTRAGIEQIATFMGWNRYDWSAAPEALIDHFEMREARAGWDAESAALEAEMAEIHARDRARADAIVDEYGDEARRIMQTGGTSALFREYENGTLGTKRRKPVTVTTDRPP